MGKTDNRRRLRQGIGLLTAALIGGMLAALAVVVTLAAPQRSFLHMPTNLSQNQSRESFFTDIAVSPDGDRVAVVWPESYADGGKPRGSVRLRWASESTGSGWSETSIFAGSYGECAIDSVVAVTGTTAHVAYISQSPCDSPSEQWLYYRSCPLGGGSCTARQQVAYRDLSGTHDAGLSSVDIALDGQGEPHFAYAYYHWDGEDVGTIYYHQLSGEEKVSGDGQDCNNPALTWSNGYVHVVWEDEAPHYSIRYARSDGLDWGERYELYPYGSDSFHPRNPDIAAQGSEVLVTFDISWVHEDDFAVAYRRNTDNGTSLEWGAIREVGTDIDVSSSDPSNKYNSTPSDEPYEYLMHLRPTVALDGEGLPTVVWHADDGTGGRDYNLYYARGVSQTITNTHWTTPTQLYQRSQDQASGVVALAPVMSPTLHVAYLQLWEDPDPESSDYDWETYYTSGAEEAEGYSFVFLPLVLRNFEDDGGGGG